MSVPDTKIHVTSETDRLYKVLVHSPDSGLGRVVPSKAQDWLFEDIVHLDTIRRKEYDYYIKLLLYFLDPNRIKGKLAHIDDPASDRNFFKPGHPDFYGSDKVIELQVLLADLLRDASIRSQLVAAVCALEACSYDVQTRLLSYSPDDLARVFLSGTHNESEMIFPPIPNFIFTRDIGTVINGHILLNRPMKEARKREALIAKYIFFHHPLFAACRGKIIELSESQHRFLLPAEEQVAPVTLEGGDVMVVSPDHVLIGVSERTTREAAAQAVNLLFEKNVVTKVTVVEIPAKRDYMHIDTVFTQVKRNVWVLLGEFSSARAQGLPTDDVARALGLQPAAEEAVTQITQFVKGQPGPPRRFASVEALLVDVSVTDLGCDPKDVQIVLSGHGIFPYDAREQWTDSCNVLALGDGVVLGYDRNDKTEEAFAAIGFELVRVENLLQALESGERQVGELRDVLVLMPSAELSRARGGFHCMSMPLLRE